MSPCLTFPTRVLGIKLRSPCIYSKHFTEYFPSSHPMSAKGGVACAPPGSHLIPCEETQQFHLEHREGPSYCNLQSCQCWERGALGSVLGDHPGVQGHSLEPENHLAELKLKKFSP